MNCVITGDLCILSYLQSSIFYKVSNFSRFFLISVIFERNSLYTAVIQWAKLWCNNLIGVKTSLVEWAKLWCENLIGVKTSLVVIAETLVFAILAFCACVHFSFILPSHVLNCDCSPALIFHLLDSRKDVNGVSLYSCTGVVYVKGPLRLSVKHRYFKMSIVSASYMVLANVYWTHQDSVRF